MRAEAEIVRSTMRWAHDLVDNWTRPTGRQYSTGYTSNSLSGMMTRADAATALAIAGDLDNIRDLAAEARLIASQQLEDEDRQSRAAPHGLDVAEELVRRSRTTLSGDTRMIFEHGCRILYWAQIARHWPGRDSHSLRDDWEKTALRFYRDNTKLFDRTVEIFFFTSGKNRNIFDTMESSTLQKNRHSSGSV
jgi:hypothetical protein